MGAMGKQGLPVFEGFRSTGKLRLPMAHLLTSTNRTALAHAVNQRAMTWRSWQMAPDPEFPVGGYGVARSLLN